MGKGCMEIIRERERRKETIVEEAKRWAKSLTFKCTAILIGSYARGDFNLWSDIDIVLISEFKGSPLERLKILDINPGFQVIPLTPTEFKILVKKKDPLAVEALEYGIILRDDGYLKMN